MTAADLEGWGVADIPFNDVFSEEDLNINKLVAAQNRKKIKSGGFQVMGLSPPVFRGILRKGYQVPTPIQRRVIPVILEGKDVVAMARTGSGKTAAFLIPLFEKLKMHSAKVGFRAIILSPTRELALQTLAFAKDLGKFMCLRAATILGGESMESQFAAMHDNPDIIIATPGRFSHLCIEMDLKMNSVEYVVFDEADLLFEMGFQEQLNAIISYLPQHRQTLLFSATLPKLLVDFARAGLNSPILIRLDVETKISENLKLGFFKINSEDKVPLLIHLLKNVIDPSEMTIVFAPTRHHVEYLHNVLTRVGITATYVYSSLDASARKISVAKFRARKATILIVTDLAARGIDIPLLDNVVNFNFPPKVKLFVHRVGRVARGARSGRAYSFVAPDEVCYLLDLHMFLSRSVKFCPHPTQAEEGEEEEKDWDRMYGRVPQDIIDDSADSLGKMLELSQDLRNMRNSAKNSIQEYCRTRPPASVESIRRLKEELWGNDIGFHPIFKSPKEAAIETERLRLLQELKNVRPKTTIFDIKKDGKKGAGSKNREALVMRMKREIDKEKIENFRSEMEKRQLRALERKQRELQAQKGRSGIDESSEVDLLTSFDTVIGKRKRNVEADRGPSETPLSSWQNSSSDLFISYAPQDQTAEQGYSVLSTFEKESARATLDLTADDGQAPLKKPQMKWDRKQKKFITQERVKKIKTESGVWVSASYKKNLYEKWKLKLLPDQTQNDGDEDAMDESSNRRDWRGGKGNKKGQESSGFVSLTESSLKYKTHPLMKGKKYRRARPTVKGVQQLRTYEERVKFSAVLEEKSQLLYERKKRRNIRLKEQLKNMIKQTRLAYSEQKLKE